jgi:hypothetical protein
MNGATSGGAMTKQSMYRPALDLPPGTHGTIPGGGGQPLSTTYKIFVAMKLGTLSVHLNTPFLASLAPLVSPKRRLHLLRMHLRSPNLWITVPTAPTTKQPRTHLHLLRPAHQPQQRSVCVMISAAQTELFGINHCLIVVSALQPTTCSRNNDQLGIAMIK